MKNLTVLFSRVCMLVMALGLPVLAQETADVSGGVAAYKALAFLGAGLAIGIGTIGPGFGLGNGVGKAMESIGRNPEAEPKIKNNMIVGLAFVEALSIYALLIALILAFK